MKTYASSCYLVLSTREFAWKCVHTHMCLSLYVDQQTTARLSRVDQTFTVDFCDWPQPLTLLPSRPWKGLSGERWVMSMKECTTVCTNFLLQLISSPAGGATIYSTEFKKSWIWDRIFCSFKIFAARFDLNLKSLWISMNTNETELFS